MLAIAATRRLVLSTRINRQLALFVVVFLTSQLVHRAFGFAFDKPIGTLLTEELFVIGACAVAGGVAFHWSFFLGAFVLWAGSFIAASRPDLAERLFTASSITALLVVGTLSMKYWRSEFSGTGAEATSSRPQPPASG